MSYHFLMIKSRILATFPDNIVWRLIKFQVKRLQFNPIKISKDKVDMISFSMHLYNFRQVGMHVHEILLRLGN